MGRLGPMLMQESRRAARSSPERYLILLDQQDRSLWNRDLAAGHQDRFANLVIRSHTQTTFSRALTRKLVRTVFRLDQICKYVAVNKPTAIPVRTKMIDPSRWQPLTFLSSTGDLMTQRFMAAHWCFVTPFALSSGDEYRSIAKTAGPAKVGTPVYEQQAEELVEISAGLTDRQKMIAEYWSDRPPTEQPPGHWMRFAQWVSARDHHTLDDPELICTMPNWITSESPSESALRGGSELARLHELA